jgi:23S rRNA pseudouridine2605 synthase
LFITDGLLAAALTRSGLAMPSEYSVRVRGAFDDSTIAAALAAAAAAAGIKGRIDAVTAAGGEGSNRWLQIRCAGLRPRDLKQLFEQCGLEANRILRTRFGPIAMDRALARGRSRALTEDELGALREAAGATGSRKPGR